MGRAWKINEEDLDEFGLDKPDVEKKFLDLVELNKRTGIALYNFETIGEDPHAFVDKLKKERGYEWEDVLIIENNGDIEAQLKKYGTEHLHDDEEIRLITGGCAYFDIRDEYDQWVRVETCEGDLIIVPAGMYHRLTLDKNRYVTMRRVFAIRDHWAAYNRPADDIDARQSYLRSIQVE